MTKTSRNTLIGVIVVVLIIVVWMMGKGNSNTNPGNETLNGEETTTPLAASETVKVSGSLSKYQNAELGFAVQYPSNWEKGDSATGVQFVIPIDKDQVSTVNRLEANISVDPGKCSFPPVTTVDSRGTIKVGEVTLNTISMSNTVQGRQYFNRMYSLEKGGVCYFFTFAFVSLSTDKLTGSNLIQAQNNNKAIKATADAAFIAMVKTLTFVAPPAGEEETKAAPKK